jgi:DNA-binding transcriptional LysR family regulator
MIEGVTIEQLRTLRAVAETGSFSAAARALGRVPAAVSQAIDRLEAQLGLRLFDRSGRAPRLTHHGEAIAAAAAGVQGEIDALDALVASLKRGTETSLAIVVDVMFPTTSLVAFAKEFAAEHPSVELVLFTEILSAVTAQVRDKRAAWGVAVEDADMAGLEARHVASVRLVPVAAPSHPFARSKRPIAAATVSKAVQIVLSERRPDGHGERDGRSERDGRDGSKDHGVLSARTWRVVDLATKHALIGSGLGWGHMPEHVVRSDLDEGRLVELRLDAWGNEPLTRSLSLVWRRGAVFGPVARWAETRLSQLCQKAVAGP